MTSISTEASGGIWSPDGKFHFVCLVGLSRLQATTHAISKGTREGEVEGQGKDFHPADVPPLDQLLRRQVQPLVHPLTGICGAGRALPSISRPARTTFHPSRSAGRISIRFHPTAKRSPTPATSTRCRRPARTATSSSSLLQAARRRRSPPIPAATRRRCIRPMASTSPIARSCAAATRATAFA